MKSSGSSPSILPRLALGLFAVFLAVSLSRAAVETAKNGVRLYRTRHDTPLKDRSHAYGPVYAQEIEKIRRTIPRDGAYILINGDPGEHGGPFWVKFDLAPRRALYLGDLDHLGNIDRLKRRMPRAARWVVIAYGPYRRPVLIERYKFVQERKAREGA
ncbi:MAG TPA: hypothetical protein VF179_32540 [Thermoanaerobaculia bacterium]|nr:hypothetical protein [Thermoanaerobaculia bacterium]